MDIFRENSHTPRHIPKITHVMEDNTRWPAKSFWLTVSESLKKIYHGGNSCKEWISQNLLIISRKVMLKIKEISSFRNGNYESKFLSFSHNYYKIILKKWTGLSLSRLRIKSNKFSKRYWEIRKVQLRVSKSPEYKKKIVISDMKSIMTQCE